MENPRMWSLQWATPRVQDDGKIWFDKIISVIVVAQNKALLTKEEWSTHFLAISRLLHQKNWEKSFFNFVTKRFHVIQYKTTFAPPSSAVVMVCLNHTCPLVDCGHVFHYMMLMESYIHYITKNSVERYSAIRTERKRPGQQSTKVRTIRKVIGVGKKQKKIEQGKMTGKKFLQRETQREKIMRKKGRIFAIKLV